MTMCSGFDTHENIYKGKARDCFIRSIPELLGASSPGKESVQDSEKVAKFQLPGLWNAYFFCRNDVIEAMRL